MNAAEQTGSFQSPEGAFLLPEGLLFFSTLEIAKEAEPPTNIILGVFQSPEGASLLFHSVSVGDGGPSVCLGPFQSPEGASLLFHPSVFPVGGPFPSDLIVTLAP